MASIIRHGEGWRAHICVDGQRQSKTFRTKPEAEAWAVRSQEDIASGISTQTFREAAEAWLGARVTQLAPKYQSAIEQSVRDYLLPELGEQRLVEINRRELVRVVRKVAARGTIDLSHRVGQRISSIFEYAVDSGEIESSPAAGLGRVLPKIKKEHYNAVKAEDLPKLLTDIRTYEEPVVRIGLQLLAHTFVRTGELIGARWDEFRLKAHGAKDDVWIIPAERMKKKRLPHVVPLSPQVLGLLDTLRPMTDEGPYVLASPTNRLTSISNNTMLFALYRMGYRGRMTGHGFRSVASSILNEAHQWHPDAIERQLAHQETDAIRGAYNRAEFFEQRQRMMPWWSNYLDRMAS